VKFSYPKEEKLKSKTLIKQLFSDGKSVTLFPLKLIYIKTVFDENIVAKTGVSVSKRNFKSAVKRNRIKRLLREVYRLNKDVFFNNLDVQYAFMILYIAKEEPTFKHIEKSMKQLFNKFSNIISNT